MKAYIFPGQGAQFTGMGLDLYENSVEAQELFEKANKILGFRITDIMFEGTAEELKETKVTQPAIFLHSVILAKVSKLFHPNMLAGHSLGEISALTAANVLSFESGLKLVKIRSEEMQKACENKNSTMAAILQMDINIVNKVCEEITGIVVPANYNCPGQVVISGEINAVKNACEKLSEAGARRALILPVGGAFHSELMIDAKDELSNAISETSFNLPLCPIYQNVNGKPETLVDNIKNNLISQLTSPVKWTQSVNKMIEDGCQDFIEIGPGKVLQGLIKKINRDTNVSCPNL